MNKDLFTWYTQSDTLADLIIGLRLAESSGAKSLLLLTCNQNIYPEEELSSLLTHCSLPIFGGIYPMITYQETLLKHGALIIGFNQAYNVTLFANLDLCKTEEHFESVINSQLSATQDFAQNDSFLMFYDGLMTNIEDFIDSFFECLDHGISIVGGGAGYIDFIQRPCLFTNQGLTSNAVLLVTLPSKLTAQVAHGWKTFQGPFLASEVEEQTILSINYQPAFELYSQTIENESQYRFAEESFFDIAKHFPLGIEDINNNLTVRELLVTENGALQCAGKVPINSMVYLLESNVNNLIEAIETAAIELYSTPISTPTEENEQISMVFDCIGRMLYMGDDFGKELEAINKHRNSPALFGVLSIGEIANSQSGAIQLLNKSTVISTW
ncbi:FIST signal transduction protein [Colwellia echini]|uniref:Histidine kinase n=1 Tax=Colwellia echini TaxID=1982103 RepID=A0ABY3MT26_9GAMM|nr:FIST C-terminal domain-containing protein [Colwellia echini]TYK64334.1 hypothetical protein CWS31_016080 [Colwellia echini]